MMTLEDVAVVTETTLRVEKKEKSHCVASLDHADIQDGGVLIACIGYGDTFLEARKDLANAISGQTLVTNAYRSYRKEVRMPKKISSRK